jgi:hypothetical protein
VLPNCDIQRKYFIAGLLAVEQNTSLMHSDELCDVVCDAQPGNKKVTVLFFNVWTDLD